MYEVNELTLSSPTAWHADTTGSSLRYFRTYFALLELIRTNVSRV